MRVRQLAEKLGVSADTVRYYTRIGLLAPTKSTANGYKFYNIREQSCLRFILSARDLGFSVEDITQIIAKADDGQSACPTVRRLIDKRLHETQQRYLDMLRLRKRMLAAVDSWDSKEDKAPTGNQICYLIEEFIEVEVGSETK
ncbi:MerR family transcriptional regulator [Arsukibacterium sp.]|uniref:MerR family transcriptional regulator n=1 Tax=Arsukibacterium sp. TaxID=1977258 RepID=UPI001BD5DBFF|nr:MerR family transcriptional regulator [Arsukibacterium sp.]